MHQVSVGYCKAQDISIQCDVQALLFIYFWLRQGCHCKMSRTPMCSESRGLWKALLLRHRRQSYELNCSVQLPAEICKSIQLPQTLPRSMAVFLPRGELSNSSWISSDTVFQEINSAFIFILVSQAMYRFLIGKQWEGNKASGSVSKIEGNRKCKNKVKTVSSCCGSGRIVFVPEKKPRA